MVSGEDLIAASQAVHGFIDPGLGIKQAHIKAGVAGHFGADGAHGFDMLGGQIEPDQQVVRGDGVAVDHGGNGSVGNTDTHGVFFSLKMGIKKPLTGLVRGWGGMGAVIRPG